MSSVDPAGAAAPGEAELLDELAGPRRALSLRESARVLGGLRWLELEGHSRLGRAAPLGARAIVVAAAASFAHAWRAEQLRSLLPVSVGLPGAEESTAPPGPLTREFAALLSAGASAGGETGALARPESLARWYGVLERAYERRRSFSQLSADAPVAHVLQRLLADVRAVAASTGLNWDSSGPEA